MICLPPQGSLDNISIIIVCFPGAPQVSQEALQQEAKLEQQIDMKVEGEFSGVKMVPRTIITDNLTPSVSLYRNCPDDEVQRGRP